MDHPFIPVLVALLVGICFAALFLGLSAVIGPKKYSKSKLGPYECGFEPLTNARERVDIKFSLVAMLFILFDVETVFFYPWAILYRKFIEEGQGLLMLGEMALFLVILLVGFVYVWRKGGLDWK